MSEHRPLGRGALVKGRDAALRRLDGGDTVAVRRPAQRTADVVAVRDRADAGRHRRAGAARRAAAGDVGIPRIQRQPVQRIFRKAAEREFGRVGQADNDRAGLLEIAHDRRIGGRDDIHLRGHTVGVGPPLIVDIFLDGDRYAVQRAGLPLPGRALSAAFAALSASSDRSTTTALSFGLTSRIRAICASTTSTEEIAPERIAAAVCNADHCQTGPLGGRALADFRETGFFCAFAPACGRADFFVDFFGIAFVAPLFRLTTVFFAISRPVAAPATLKAPRPRVETGGGFCVVAPANA